MRDSSGGGDCNGIYKKFEEEYDKMNPSYDMIH